MGGVHHHIGAELAANGAGSGFGGIGRAQGLTDLGDSVGTFKDDDPAGHCAGALAFRRGTFAFGAAGHEADDVIELTVAVGRAEYLADLCLGGLIELAAQCLFNIGEDVLGDPAAQFGAESIPDGTVKLHRLSGGHLLDLDADDVQSGAAEEIQDMTGPRGGKAEVIRLEHGQRDLRANAFRVLRGVAKDAAVLIVFEEYL